VLPADSTVILPAGAPYFSKAGEVIDIEGQLKLFLMCPGMLGRLG
jgi:hypothetical protein